MIQHVLAHRYELLEHVGGGGMADVYRANDKLLNRYVAIKILHAQFSNDAEFIEKFHREAQGAARLSHPNIVNIYDVGEEGDQHYIVMEYVAGNTLKSRIQEQGHLSVEESLHIAKEIASALEHAHCNNLVHCDIKPHNILMMPDGRIKVADFGIARAVTASTMTYSGNVVGSVHYFSPEQAKGGAITPKSDIYSLGVVLYEMLTGELPFTGETTISIALKHLQEEPRTVRQINPEIPTVVESIVSKAMSKDPSERPDSTELIYDIQQAENRIYQNSAQVADPFATQILPRVGHIPSQNSSYYPDKEMGDEEEKKSVFKSKKFIFGLITILVLGFFAGAFLSYGKFWSTAEIAVPDVVGKQMNLAKQMLEDKKLRVNVAETYDANVPAGQVVSQYPEAGAKVKEQRQVTIYVSKGGEEIEMPDLKGMTRANAEDKLRKLGLKPGSIYEKYSSEEAGTVISQDPRAGTKINKGQAVDIVISKGEKTKQVSLPDYSGGTLDAARANLSSLNLRVGNVTKQDSKQAEGTVISQSPSPGSQVNEGGSVDLVIAAPGKNTGKNSTKPTDTDNNKGPSKKNETGKTEK
jgi:eukaryotic-like serine/threonine-protein kinase